MRIFNFSPGPAALPLEVLEQAQGELLDWHQSGMSVMEISHRSKAFEQVAAEAEADLRELLSIPRNYQVLFLQGGASAEFSSVPLNLASAQSTVDYVNTGHWSQKAIAEAGRHCRVHVAGDAGGDYRRGPPPNPCGVSPRAPPSHFPHTHTPPPAAFLDTPPSRPPPPAAPT